ncbi:gliding motility-associated C-terminal domain-containing protein [Capnocytophaga leadbetteri]|uniref:T9SS type B sorting domain-containing protein n=1 Tax=Capnocytophaga leadbetteri TaxID=327575 RepID=UPI00288B793B|nr:gliding motility-associated C-terminal domain-containing protein [Capnocytophaga leadbetteri]
MNFALDNFQEKEIVRLSVPEGITTVEVEITLPLGIEYAEGTAVITKGEAKIIQKTGTLLSQPTFVVTINKGNTITFEFNRKVTSQALLLKGELKDTVKLKVGQRLYDTKLSNSYYLRSPSLFLQPSPIVFDKKDGEHNDFFVLSNMGIGGVKDIYFSVDYPEEVSLIDLKYKGKKILPIGVVPAGYANAGAPLYRVEGIFLGKKKDRIIIYEHYTVANCQSNCPIKYAAYWGDNTLYFYETKEEIKLLHPKEESTVITLSDDTYTLTTTHSITTTAITVGSVFTNDRLNGKPIDIQKVIFSLLPQSTPTSFVITKDGNIIVPPQTPIGRYTLNYRICDNSQPSKDKSLKPICQTATVTIAVLQSVTTTTTTSTTVTATTTPTVVTPTVITLSDDIYTVTTTESTTTIATTVGSVFTNDRLNGKLIDIQKVIFTLLPQSTPNTFVITKDGNIIVPAKTPIGRYTLNYCICDNSQPSKDKNHKPVCQTATVTIVILQLVTTPTTTTSTTLTTTTTTTPTLATPTVITLSDDTYTVTTTASTTTTATTIGSVFTNDRVNGKSINIQKVIFSLLPQSTPNTFIITKDGNIIIPAQTPIGCYTLNYRICDNSQPSKDKRYKPICQTATVTIVILQSVTTPTTATSTTTSTTVTTTTTPTIVTPTTITLSDDTYTITTTESSTTTATTVGSVFSNDRLNRKPIDIQKVIFSLLPQSTLTSFVITKDGNVIIPAQTPIGRYTLNYRICDNSQTSKEKNQKPICQIATVTIAVLQSVTTPTTTTSITVTATTTPTVITLSDDTYTVTTTESTTTTATTVGSVFTNDRLNGNPIDIQKVIFSLLPQSTPNTFIITKDGNIIVPAHTPIGHYTLNYRICDNSQTSKDKNHKPICQTATVTIVILQSVTTPTTSTTITATTTTPTVIILSDDTYTLTTTHSTTTTATTVGSVFTNDRLNGKPIDIQKVIFSLLPQSTPNTFIITKDGNIIVPPQTPIGRYTLNYRICNNSQPSKNKNFKPVCQTATVTIVILQSVTTPTTTTSTTTTATVITPTIITLSDDTYTLTTTESSTTTATTVGSVFTNDRLNGKPIDIQKVIFSLLPQSTPNTFVITKEGNIIVPAQTPIGHYTLNYRICDNSQPSKGKNFKPVCQTATVTIVVQQSVTTPTTTTNTIVTATTTPTVVTPTVITLSDDTYTITTTESFTTTVTTVGSVFTNDHLNGKPIDIQKVIFSLLPQSTPNTFVITKNGNIIVPPHTSIGRYTLNYRICNSQTLKDKNLKPICKTATVTIAVLQSVITPTTTTSTTVTATTTPTIVTPTVITLSDDTYTLTTTKSTTTTATTVGSVFTNDCLNGKPIDIQKVIFSLLPQSTPNTFVITKDGNIIIPAKTPMGRYILNYRICDNSQPSKDKSQKTICKTATVTIAILQLVTTPTTTTNTTVTTTTTPTVITLSDDTYTLTTTESTTTTATTVGSVFTNDRLNGKPIDIQKVIFSLLPQSTPNTFVITKDGNIIVPAQTPIGRYTLNYRICDNSQTLKNKNQKPVCQTATVTIVVLQSVTTTTTTTSTTITATTTTPTVITLSDDTYTITTTESSTTTATTVGSVFANDSMNGKPIDIQKVIFSLLPQSTPNTFIITKDGNIIVPPQTPMGRYTLNYRICDNSQTSKNKSLKPICKTATVTIVVRQTVTTPTTTTSTTVTATTTPTIVTPTVITLSDDTYTLTTTESSTTTATTVGSVFSNDRLNGKPIDIQKVIFSLLPQSTPNTFVITKDGNIIVPPHSPIGRYTLNYRICDNSQTSKDKNLKSICQTATVTIAVLQSVTTPTTATNTTVTATTTPTVVTPTVITLSDDTYIVTTTESVTTTATTVGSVFTNDRLNGKPIDIQKVTFSLLPQSTPNTFVITKDGNIIILPHTPMGRYTLNYRICDNSQPSKDKSQKPICQTATVTIAVLQSVTTSTIITLSDDTYTITTTESSTTTATTVGSVFANDRLNGKPIDIQKVIFSLLPQSTPNTFIITKDGNIIVPSHTPIGRYTLNYRICDSKNKNQKPICQTATITITILQTPVTPTVSATVETATSSTTQSATNQPIAVSDSATTPMNTPIRIAVLDNDTPYTASPKIVIFPTNGDAFVKEDNTILYRPRVRFIGTDYFVYELCTPSSQSCTTATVTVKVTHKVVADNAMSANGDDKNDYFHIVGIENYPDNQVIIYNRKGEKVFTISHYDNRQRAFKGIVEGEVSLPNAALLPQDTYFYLIEYYDETRQLQRQIGWLYLKR